MTAPMNKDIRAGIQGALATLSDDEVLIITLAALHGVPMRELAGKSRSQEDVQALMIGSLKKLRKALAEQGLTSADLQKLFRS